MVKASAGCGQSLSSTTLSSYSVWLPLFFLMLYCLTASSVLIIIGVMPVRMQSASLDVVRNALDIRMFIGRCTLIYFCLLCSYFMASIQTGAPYSRRGKMAPLYMVSKLHV